MDEQKLNQTIRDLTEAVDILYDLIRVSGDTLARDSDLQGKLLEAYQKAKKALEALST